MKRTVFSLFLLALVLFSSCAAPTGDFFEVFEGSYTAELEGTLFEFDFCATLQMEKSEGEGVAPATVTFYAPEEISGTVITRTGDGTVTLTAGELTVSDMGGVGEALFSLFPTDAAVTESSVSEEGHTLVRFEGGELTFLEDGTPYTVKTPNVTATVVKFKQVGARDSNK